MSTIQFELLMKYNDLPGQEGQAGNKSKIFKWHSVVSIAVSIT
jgi:hypothetical protein